MWIGSYQLELTSSFPVLKCRGKRFLNNRRLEQISRVFDTFCCLRCEIQCADYRLDDNSSKTSAHSFEEPSCAFLLRAFDWLRYET
jgi:hypothetical protein